MTDIEYAGNSSRIKVTVSQRVVLLDSPVETVDSDFLSYGPAGKYMYFNFAFPSAPTHWTGEREKPLR